MHAKAMILFKKQQGVDLYQYAPIAKAFSTMDGASRELLKRKFDMAYMIAKEKLPFTKMIPICELEEHHEVQLGQGYKNDHACATFIKHIAEEQQQVLITNLSSIKFLFVQVGGSTDSGNVDDELFTVQYFDSKIDDGTVHVRNQFLTVRQLKHGDSKGIFDSFKAAMSYGGIVDWDTKLIGFGCDGAAVNIAAGGLRGKLESTMPWIIVFWCLAHRLELALKDALKQTFFSTIDEMLMRLYYLYEKSPKKCAGLDDVVQELRLCLDEIDVPKSRGNRPLRACGTRFIAHKVAALGSVIDKYGIFLSHLVAMSEDRTFKSADREKRKLKSYVRHWRNFKVLPGCAFFHDLLKLCFILCKVLQADEVCVVRAIELLLKTKKNIDKMKLTNLQDLPTVKKVIERINQISEGGTTRRTYQQAEVTNYEQASKYYQEHWKEYMGQVQDCLRDKVNIHHIEVINDTLTILATNGWGNSDDASFGHAALECVSQQFRVPLVQPLLGYSAKGLQNRMVEAVQLC